MWKSLLIATVGALVLVGILSLGVFKTNTAQNTSAANAAFTFQALRTTNWN